jgi:hypothetical protein
MRACLVVARKFCNPAPLHSALNPITCCPTLFDLISSFPALCAVVALAAAASDDAKLKDQIIYDKKVVKEDKDPEKYGDDTGKTCMGGSFKDIKLDAKCERLLGYIAVDGTDLKTLNMLKNIKEIVPWNGMKGPKGSVIYVSGPSILMLDN